MDKKESLGFYWKTYFK